MAVIDLSMVVGAIVEMGVEATWEKAKRKEAVIRVLDKLRLKPDIPPRGFDGVYAFTLVAYGIGKPKPMLDFFRHKFIRVAFKKSFERRDPSILHNEAENLLDWAELGQDLRQMDVDPRREFARFTAVFSEMADLTRTPAEVRRDHKLDDVYQRTVEILEQLESLPLLSIRAELARVAQIYDVSQSKQAREETDWGMLRQQYLDRVRNRYQMLELRGLAPRLLEGPPDLLLSEVYVELPLRLGLQPLIEFEVHESEVVCFEERLPSPISEDQPEVSGLAIDRVQIEYEPVRREKTLGEEAPQRKISVWDAVALSRIIIVGEPGAGKTTTLRYLALALTEESGAELDQRFSDHLPIVARLSKFARRLESEPGLRLATHLCDQFKPEFGPLLERALDAGRCLVLLDGLDEVSNLSAIVEHINEFTAGYGQNKIVVTSREHAVRRAPIGMGFQTVKLNPMGEEQIDAFIDRWYSARSATQASEGNGWRLKGPEGLKRALRTRPKLAELAENPLMLTIVVLMHWRASALPSRPIEVYQAATDTLIEHWPRFQDRVGMESWHLQTVKQVLMPIAYRMLRGNALMGEDQLLRRLTEEIMHVNSCDEGRARETAIRWMGIIIEQSGLVMSVGLDRQERHVFEFLHRRLAEYLAACHLSERWAEGDLEFVFDHIHQPQWTEVFLLFTAQIGLGSMVRPTKVLRAILSLKSPWEKTVWRDHLLAGRCLGEGVLVTGDLRNQIFERLVDLLTSRSLGLRTSAVEVFAGLRGTQYQRAAIEHLRYVLEKEWPWYIRIFIAKAFLKLGEREHSHQLLIELCDAARRRGHDELMALATELLLEGWKEETVDWLLDVARRYEGRGLRLSIYKDPSETEVYAGDQSFSSVHVGKCLSRVELQSFIDQLMRTLVIREQQEKARWVWCQLCELPINEVRERAIQGHAERVRLLAAEWLVEHGERDVGLRVLIELATQGDGNLQAVRALGRLGELESATLGIQTTLSKSLGGLDAAIECQVITVLAELGEEMEMAIVSVELLLSKFLNAEQTYSVARTLLGTPAHEVGLATLRALAASVQHTYRYEAAEALAEAGEIDEAYRSLVDIARQWGALDRAHAMLALNDPRYVMKLSQDQLSMKRIAGQVVHAVSDKYSVVTSLLERGIVPEVSGDTLAMQYSGPKVSREEWDELAQEAWLTFRREAEAWLRVLPEQYGGHPYAQSALAYLQAETGQKDEAITTLQEVAVWPGISATLMLRVGWRLLRFESREIGLETLRGIPIQTANETKAWLQLALALISLNERDQALDAVQKVMAAADEFQTRYGATLLLNLLGHAEEEDLLFRGIDLEVPQRRGWLVGSEYPEFGEVVVNLARHMVSLDPEFVYALVSQAEALRKLERLNEALETVNSALEIDDHYARAWRVKGETLENSGQREGAITALQRAIELDPSHRWAQCFQANLLREVGQYEDALVFVDQTLRLNERYAWAWAVKGETLENVGQREDALASLGRAIELSPDYARAWALKAETLRRLGCYDKALESVERTLKVDERHRLAWRVKSKILDSMGRYQEALEMLVEALESEDTQIREGAVWALCEIGDTQAVPPLLTALKDKEVKVRKATAWALGTLGDQRATTALAQALTDTDGEVCKAAAGALLELEDIRAMDHLVDALGSSDSSVRREVAMALGPIADERIVDRLAEMVLEDEETVAEGAAHGLALVNINQEKVLGILQQAVKRRRRVPMLYSRLGVLLRRMGRLSDAISAHSEAVQLGQQRAVIFSSRALTYHVRAEYGHAIEDYRKAIVLDPNWSGPWEGLGNALFEVDQDDDAVRAWWRAESKAYGDSGTLAELGVGLWMMKELDKALRLWRRALEREPRLGREWEWLKREHGWGPRMIQVTQEIVATLSAT